MLPLSLVAIALTSTLAVAQEQGGRNQWDRGSVGFGCWPARPTQQDATTPYYQTGNAANVAGCSSNCAVLRPGDTSLPLFWYWQGTSQQCWCGNFYQRPNQQVSGNTPCFTGAGDTRGQWAYGRVSTTFTTFGTSACRTRAAVTLANSAFSAGQVGPAGCHSQCRFNRFAYWWSDTATNNMRCACSDTVQTGVGASATCAANTVFVWEHSIQAQASGLTRRKRRSAFAEQEPVELCPKGLSACALRNTKGGFVEGAFECIDTQTELESCGGCVDGLMQYNGTVTFERPGVNCESEGVALGRSSCANGICQASACRRGWHLVGGGCVKR